MLNNTEYGVCNVVKFSVIIWNNPDHDFKDFHLVGNYSAKRSGEYFLIPSLSAGGAVTG